MQLLMVKSILLQCEAQIWLNDVARGCFPVTWDTSRCDVHLATITSRKCWLAAVRLQFTPNLHSTSLMQKSWVPLLTHYHFMGFWNYLANVDDIFMDQLFNNSRVPTTSRWPALACDLNYYLPHINFLSANELNRAKSRSNRWASI